MRSLFFLITWVFLLLLAEICHAQDIQAFSPTNGHWNFLSLDNASIGNPKDINLSFHSNYSRNPLVEADSIKKTNNLLIENLTTLNLVASYSPNSRFEIILDTPYGFSAGQKKAKSLKLQKQNMLDDGGQLNNIRLSPKFIILNQKDFGSFGLALSFPQSIPLKNETQEIQKSYFSSSAKMILSYQIARFRISTNIGYRHRFNSLANPTRIENCSGSKSGICYNPFYLGDAILYGIAMDLTITSDTKIIAEVFGKTFFDQQKNPMEAIIGLRSQATANTSFYLSFGKGITLDLSTPDFRFVAGMSWQVSPEKDSDGDGIVDQKDMCIDLPEDKDQNLDLDGCPDLDNDGDQIEDSKDKCPNQAEDLDGFEDNDGCQDADNDKDGMLDIRDSCPNQAEDFDKYQDSDGCPDENELEGHIRVEKGIIITTNTIFFQKQKSILVFPQSNKAFEYLALFLQKHPQVKKVLIEAHSDNSMAEIDSVQLTQERADAIKHTLLSLNIDQNRLETKGFGFSKPWFKDDTEKQSLNRRIVFRITEHE